jgi:hypothetical protein
MLDVEVVEADAFGDGGVSVQPADLGPSGQPGPHPMPVAVARYLLLEPRREIRPFRPGPDQGHLATQHVDELGHLVKVGAA